MPESEIIYMCVCVYNYIQYLPKSVINHRKKYQFKNGNNIRLKIDKIRRVGGAGCTSSLTMRLTCLKGSTRCARGILG